MGQLGGDCGQEAEVSAVGYSGKTVWQKLGLREGIYLSVLGNPEDWSEMVGLDFHVMTVAPWEAELVHLFVVERAMLERELARLWKDCLRTVSLWVSWPKRDCKRKWFYHCASQTAGNPSGIT